MRFPRTSEYTFRVMAQFAITHTPELLRAEDLSKTTGIPAPFLSKILRRLVKKGLLTAKKGCGGGYTLARSLKEIRFMDILQAGNYSLESKHCLFGWKRCSDKNPCPIHPLWVDMKESFQKWAENTTLANLQKS